MPDSCKAHEGDEESDQCASVCVTVKNVGIEEEEKGVMSKVREQELGLYCAEMFSSETLCV